MIANNNNSNNNKDSDDDNVDDDEFTLHAPPLLGNLKQGAAAWMLLSPCDRPMGEASTSLRIVAFDG